MFRNPLKIKALIRFIAILPVLFAVVSCSQLTHVNCDPDSWHGQGVRDGLRGTSPKAVNEYERTCSQQSGLFNRQDYLAGLKEGNAEYCSGQNGFHLGLGGVESDRVCVNEDAVAFNDGLKAGRKLRKAITNLYRSKVPNDKYVLGGFTVLQGNSALLHQGSENNEGFVGGTRGLGSNVALARSQSVSSKERVSRIAQRADRVAECEEAKRNAEEKGFDTGSFVCELD